jgi:uncharacterized protein YndB with AHSA1/START domain
MLPTCLQRLDIHLQAQENNSMSMSNIFVTVECTAAVPIEKAWEIWNDPNHIVHWNVASPDWHTPRAEVDLKAGGRYTSRFEAKDGSAGFDCEGIYDEIVPLERIGSHFSDGRRIEVTFEPTGGGTKVSQKFEVEAEKPAELQRVGWQNIMDNFKVYAESV